MSVGLVEDFIKIVFIKFHSKWYQGFSDGKIIKQRLWISLGNGSSVLVANLAYLVSPTQWECCLILCSDPGIDRHAPHVCVSSEVKGEEIGYFTNPKISQLKTISVTWFLSTVQKPWYKEWTLPWCLDSENYRRVFMGCVYVLPVCLR